MTGIFFTDFLSLFGIVGVIVFTGIYWRELRSFAVRHRSALVIFALGVVGFLLIFSFWKKWPDHNHGVKSILTKWPNEALNSALTENAKPGEIPNELARAGQAGDLFGGFTALVTALTFGAAVGALFFQGFAMQAGRRQLALQQFESTFLFLLEQYRRLQVGPQLKILSSGPPDYWSKKVDSEQAMYRWNESLGERLLGPMVGAVAKDFYLNEIYRINRDKFGPMFRALYHVFKAIKVSNLSESEKIRYANIARLSLDEHQLTLLSLNGITAEGSAFKPLIEEYGLLKHLFGETVEVRDALTPAQLVAVHCYRRTAVLKASERARFWDAHPTLRPGPLTE